MIDLIKLHALADGELSEQEAKLLREQILASEEASRELSAIHNLKDCIRSKAQIYTCEATFVASMRRVDELDRNRRVNRFVSRYAWGISGAFFVMIACCGILNRTAGTRVQTSDIASMYALAPNSAPQRVPPPGYNQWIQDLVRNARIVGDLDGHRVSKLMLSDPYGMMGLMDIEGDIAPDGMTEVPGAAGYYSGNIQGHNAVARKEPSRLLVLIGDRPSDALLDTLRHIRMNP